MAAKILDVMARREPVDFQKVGRWEEKTACPLYPSQVNIPPREATKRGTRSLFL